MGVRYIRSVPQENLPLSYANMKPLGYTVVELRYERTCLRGFGIQKEEGLYYLCSVIKGTDKLRSYCPADLPLCFCICKMQVFS